MTPEQLRRAKAVFDQASAMPAEQREPFVKDACADDSEVLAEVLDRLERFTAESETSAGAVTVTLPPASPPRAGDTIGPYKLLRRIGVGGMGQVYKASQEHPIRRTVAVKVIREDFLDSEQVIARFESERQALALMNHPNIARVLDAGTDRAGNPYFVMDYIRGVPITKYCDLNNLNTDERLELLIQVCEGVQHAHQKGVIHRDIKPGNILVEVQGGRAVPKIIDFGVARATDREVAGQTMFTEFGKVVGTPEYMSPEQLEVSGLDIDTRTDIYSLGVVLYELLVGALPFDSRELRRAGLEEARRKIREETPHKPSTRLGTLEDSPEIARHRGADPDSLVHECQGDLDWITMKALEKDRTRRYASASEFAADLRHHLANEPVSASPPSVGYRIQKFVRRHRIGVGMAAAGTLLFVLGFAGTAYGLVRARAAEKQARLEAETVSEVRDFMLEMYKINDPSEARGNTITAREILDRSAARIRGELRDRPALQSRLMESMGKVYDSLGLYRDGEPLLVEAVEASRRAHGEEAREVAQVLNSHSALLIKRREGERAVPLLEEALRIQEATLGTDSPEVGRTLNNLGGAYRAEGRYEEAESYYERSLAIRQRALGPEHPDVAKVWSNLGGVRIQLEDFGGARDALERALAIRREVLPPGDPAVPRTMNSLAALMRRTGALEEARSTVERAIALQEETLGSDHPELVNTLLNLATIERKLGDPGAARTHLERALVIGTEKLRRTDPRLAVVRGQLIKVYTELGELDKAAEIRRRFPDAD